MYGDKCPVDWPLSDRVHATVDGDNLWLAESGSVM